LAFKAPPNAKTTRLVVGALKEILRRNFILNKY